MFSDDLYRKIVDLGPTEQAIIEEVVREASLYVTQRTPLGYDIARRQNDETKKRLRSYSRKLNAIELLLNELDSPTPPSLEDVVGRIRRLISR